MFTEIIVLLCSKMSVGKWEDKISPNGIEIRFSRKLL